MQLHSNKWFPFASCILLPLLSLLLFIHVYLSVRLLRPPFPCLPNDPTNPSTAGNPLDLFKPVVSLAPSLVCHSAVLSPAAFSPTESGRVIYLIFEIQPRFIFIPGTLYTPLISQPHRPSSRAILPVSHEDERGTEMSVNQRLGLERDEWVEFQDHGVEGLAPRGLRYSPDIERSKPSHHWNYQSLPLPPFPLYSLPLPPCILLHPLPFPILSLVSFSFSLHSALANSFYSAKSSELYYIAIVLLRCSLRTKMIEKDFRFLPF